MTTEVLDEVTGRAVDVARDVAGPYRPVLDPAGGDAALRALTAGSVRVRSAGPDTGAPGLGMGRRTAMPVVVETVDDDRGSRG